jgi:hypothetical protein
MGAELTEMLLGGVVRASSVLPETVKTTILDFAIASPPLLQTDSHALIRYSIRFAHQIRHRKGTSALAVRDNGVSKSTQLLIGLLVRLTASSALLETVEIAIMDIAIASSQLLQVNTY